MFSNIVVGTDGSDTAALAVKLTFAGAGALMDLAASVSIFSLTPRPYAVDMKFAPIWLPFGVRPSKDGVTITDDGRFKATFGFLGSRLPSTT